MLDDVVEGIFGIGQVILDQGPFIKLGFGGILHRPFMDSVPVSTCMDHIEMWIGHL